MREVVKVIIGALITSNVIVLYVLSWWVYHGKYWPRSPSEYLKMQTRRTDEQYTYTESRTGSRHVSVSNYI